MVCVGGPVAGASRSWTRTTVCYRERVCPQLYLSILFGKDVYARESKSYYKKVRGGECMGAGRELMKRKVNMRNGKHTGW